MNIVLTNDDGIEAEGLNAVAEALSRIANVTVVAPEEGVSCCGHSVTTTRGIGLRKIDDRRYAVAGYPADCVRVALLHLGLKPDWVLSGINHGGNLGVDIWMSGTVAAAREAVMLGYQAVALSQYRRLEVPVDWAVSAARAVDVFQWIRQLEHGGHGVWNVNLPAIAPDSALPTPSFCKPDHQAFEFRLDSTDNGLQYKGNYHGRPRASGTDVDLCFSGIPSVSLLPIQTA